MRKRWFGYAAWLLASACLYFFENNTGTRTVLICSILFPLIPTLRAAFFTEDGIFREETPRRKTARTSVPRASEEPGDIRLYQPGDPVRAIHWPTTAKTGRVHIALHDPSSGTRLLVLLNGQKTEKQWSELMDYEQAAIEYGISLAASLSSGP